MSTPLLQLFALVVIAVLAVPTAHFLYRRWRLIFPPRVRYPTRDEGVQFTVYRPDVIEASKTYKLLAFAHTSSATVVDGEQRAEPEREIKTLVDKVLADAPGDYEARVSDARRPLEREGLVTFKPEFEGLAFQPSRYSFTWTGELHQATFSFAASPEMEGKVAYGQMRVY